MTWMRNAFQEPKPTSFQATPKTICTRKAQTLTHVSIVAYDAPAGLEAAGLDVRDAWNGLKPFGDQTIHETVEKQTKIERTMKRSICDEKTSRQRELARN